MCLFSQINIPQSISTDFFFRTSFGEPLKIVPPSQNYGQPLIDANAGQSLTEKLEKAVAFDLNLIIQWQVSLFTYHLVTRVFLLLEIIGKC